MKKEEFNILEKSFIQKPEKVIHAILDDLENCSKISQGYEKVMENWEEIEASEVNMKKQLKTAAKTVKSLCEMNRRMALVLMVYVMGNNFSSDSAHVMLKLGDGQEALQELLKSKFRGR